MSFSRKLRIEDIMDIPIEKKQHNNSFKNVNQIPINQQVFGHKKRIKP
jgi:hypothetical protein